jgi:acetyl esterase
VAAAQDFARPDPRAPLHPQVKALFDALIAVRPPERVLDAPLMRSQEPPFAAWLSQGAPAVAIEKEIAIPGPAGNMRALLFAPESSGRLPVVVYFHGGGYVRLSPDTHVRLTKQLAIAAEAIVISIDYRLAPEHPYPAGPEDCIAAFRWVRQNADELGGDPSRIAVAGDSAGGGLAASTTLRLLADGEAPPSAVVLFCPWLDLTLSSDSYRILAPDDLILDDEIVRWFRECYARRPEQWTDPLVSPVLADVSGFPPTCVVAGTIDPLCDEAIAFADKLQQAGVEVALQRHAGMPHEFMLFPGIDEGLRAIEDACAFLRAHLAKQASTPTA